LKSLGDDNAGKKQTTREKTNVRSLARKNRKIKELNKT